MTDHNSTIVAWNIGVIRFENGVDDVGILRGGKPEKIALLKIIKRKWGRVALACLRNLA